MYFSLTLILIFLLHRNYKTQFSSTQDTHTYMEHNSAKWGRQQWSIMWMWALHKSIASKNRNAAIVNRTLNCWLEAFRGTWMKFWLKPHLGHRADRQLIVSTGARRQLCPHLSEWVWMGSSCVVLIDPKQKQPKKLLVNIWALKVYRCLLITTIIYSDPHSDW